MQLLALESFTATAKGGMTKKGAMKNFKEVYTLFYFEELRSTVWLVEVVRSTAFARPTSVATDYKIYSCCLLTEKLSSITNLYN